MKNNFYNRSIIIIRELIKFFSAGYNIVYSGSQQSPAVYIVHHQNLKGPITAIIRMKAHMHMWVLSPFLNQKTCFNHYVNYTFTKRFGLPKVLAYIVVLPVSYFVSWLLNAIKAIPVYRGKRDIVLSFKLSTDALIRGECLLISPDIDYTDKGSDMGLMYDGFLNIDRYYFKETGRHVPFIPVHINKAKHSIYIGKSISFTDKSIFNEEKKAVKEKLMEEFQRIQRL